jgi:hypothetical protein
MSRRKGDAKRWVDCVGIHCEPTDVGWSPVPEESLKALLEGILRTQQMAENGELDADYLEFVEATREHREIVFQEE